MMDHQTGHILMTGIVLYPGLTAEQGRAIYAFDEEVWVFGLKRRFLGGFVGIIPDAKFVRCLSFVVRFLFCFFRFLAKNCRFCFGFFRVLPAF